MRLNGILHDVIYAQRYLAFLVRGYRDLEGIGYTIIAGIRRFFFKYCIQDICRVLTTHLSFRMPSQRVILRY